MSDEANLNELDKLEFKEIAKALDKNFSEEKFERDWLDFQEMKAEHLRRKSLN